MVSGFRQIMVLTWTQTFFNNQTIYALAVLGINVFAGTSSGVYLSTNNGNTWSQTPLANKSVRSLATKGSIIYAGTMYNGIWLSSTNGTSWQQTVFIPSISVHLQHRVTMFLQDQIYMEFTVRQIPVQLL